MLSSLSEFVNRRISLKKNILAVFILVLFFTGVAEARSRIEPGAERAELYLPLLANKTVGVFANHSSLTQGKHLVDFLLSHHVHVQKIFAPEHGFRGEQDVHVMDSVDQKTGIPIISLYGKKLKPTSEDLEGLDILVFDIQDVGVRFYTYISSLQKFMEASLENKKPLIILDRPNPNGFYVDGPVLERKYQCFTGMQPVPVVYGMTIGEYAKMLVGERWLKVAHNGLTKELKLTVIPCANYSHESLYVPPVKPSPNLKTIQAIYYYPSIGIMEATAMSVGRGTRTPFQVFGHPSLSASYSFVPELIVGGEAPRYKNQRCYGWDLRANPKVVLARINKQFQLKYLLEAYRLFPNKGAFFQGFNYAAGNAILARQIKAGMSEVEIRKSWEKPLNEFMHIRKKYLLYEDFK